MPSRRRTLSFPTIGLSGVVPAFAALVLLSGCGAQDPGTTPAPATTSAIATTAAPVPAPGGSTSSGCPSAEPSARSLSMAYSLVLDSRGAADHATDTKSFADQTRSFSAEVQDCPALYTSAAVLSIQAATIDDPSRQPAPSQAYELAREDGQQIFDTLGITDHKFGDDPVTRR